MSAGLPPRSPTPITRARFRHGSRRPKMVSTSQSGPGLMRAEVASRSKGAMLRVTNVSVYYDGAIAALDQVNLEVDSGALIALLGANGAGKTTLLKAIAGKLPFERGEVTAGNVVFGDFSCVRAHPA